MNRMDWALTQRIKEITNRAEVERNSIDEEHCPNCGDTTFWEIIAVVLDDTGSDVDYFEWACAADGWPFSNDQLQRSQCEQKRENHDD